MSWLQMRGAARAAQILSKLCFRQLSTSTARSSGKVFEYRIYQSSPSKMKDALHEMKVLLPYRTAISPLSGFWITELGGLNEMHFLWEYESYTHRTAVRERLAGDKEWQEKLLPLLLPLLTSQTNMTWKPFSWYEPQLGDDNAKRYALYELVRHDIKPGMVDQFEYESRQGLSTRLSHDYPKPLGIWQCEFGPNQRVFSIFPHVSMEAWEEYRQFLFTQDQNWSIAWRETMKLMNEVTVKMLKPPVL